MFKKKKTRRRFSSVVRKLEKIEMKERKTVKFTCEKKFWKRFEHNSTIYQFSYYLVVCTNVICVIEAVMLGLDEIG